MDKENASKGPTASAEAVEPDTDAGASDPLASLTAERDELRDLVQRSRAEFENFRRRVEREKMDLVEHGAAQAFLSVVGILDDFERALKTESTDKEWARGVEMIHQRFAETLKREGLEPMECEGDRFDPNLHYAVDRAVSEDVEEDTILEVYQKGYYYKGKLLRPAMVKVAVKA
ncbi:MAG: nucleotide exchange factor GrpE [Bryobacteraceae bacterium]